MGFGSQSFRSGTIADTSGGVVFGFGSSSGSRRAALEITAGADLLAGSGIGATGTRGVSSLIAISFLDSGAFLADDSADDSWLNWRPRSPLRFLLTGETKAALRSIAGSFSASTTAGWAAGTSVAVSREIVHQSASSWVSVICFNEKMTCPPDSHRWTKSITML